MLSHPTFSSAGVKITSPTRRCLTDKRRKYGSLGPNFTVEPCGHFTEDKLFCHLKQLKNVPKCLKNIQWIHAYKYRNIAISCSGLPSHGCFTLAAHIQSLWTRYDPCDMYKCECISGLQKHEKPAFYPGNWAFMNNRFAFIVTKITSSYSAFSLQRGYCMFFCGDAANWSKGHSEKVIMMETLQ